MDPVLSSLPYVPGPGDRVLLGLNLRSLLTKHVLKFTGFLSRFTFSGL